MQINKISTNENFNGWTQYARNRIQHALGSGKYGSSFMVDRLFQEIAQNSPYHKVSVDSVSYKFPVFRAVRTKNYTLGTDIAVHPGDSIFNKTIRSSLRKLNRILKKETSKIDKILDEQYAAKQATPIVPEPAIKTQNAMLSPTITPKRKEPPLTGLFEGLDMEALQKKVAALRQQASLPIIPEPISALPPPNLERIAKKFTIAKERTLNALSEKQEVLMQGPPPIVNPLKARVVVNSNK